MSPNQPPQGFGGPPGATTFPPSTYPPPASGFPPPQGPPGPPGGFEPHQGPPGGGFGPHQGPPGGFEQPHGQPGGYGPHDPPAAYQQPQGPQPHGTATFPAAGFPQGPPQGGGSTGWGAPPDSDQDRFNSFQPDRTAASEAPAKPEADAPPKERNLRVFVLVVIAAALLVIIPLGVVYLLTLRGSDGAFSPEVGSCVKQSGTDRAVAAQCTEPNAFTVVSKEDDQEKCADKSQPHIELAGDGGKVEVLCLKPATSG
jgi:hypothetical protein